MSMRFIEVFNSTRTAIYPFTVALETMTFHWHLLHQSALNPS